MIRFVTLVAIFLTLFAHALGPVGAQDNPASYDIGSPKLADVYISPAGNDANSGTSRDQALQTIAEAWNRIPTGETLTDTGYRILILPGTYAPEAAPNYWESHYGTFEHPIILEAADGPNTAYLPSLNIYDTRYLYLFGLNVEPGTDALHCEKCDHIVVRNSRFVGADPETYEAQETVKFNQSQYIYFENNDISGAWDNPVDFVAVQYGHFLNNHIHNGGDWCMYLKGGSAYFWVEGNEYNDCGTGGFTAGQGTGFQYMVAPWIQYEAYDIKFVHNMIHDTDGAALGVQGGYNILIAYNSMYHIGARSHLLEFGFGLRTCDGQPGDEGRERCDQNHDAGGWGNNVVDDGTKAVRIPNRNVFVYNNVIVNPAGQPSGYQHFAIFAPADAANQIDSNVPAPALADDNLQIRGNVIWNGDTNMPLGIESNDFPAGCQNNNPTCNAGQLLADNAMNQFQPTFAAPNAGNFTLADGAADVRAVYKQPMPDFIWDVSAPQGNLSNQIAPPYSG